MINFGVVTLEWKLLNDSRISCTKCPRVCSSLCLYFLFLRDIERLQMHEGLYFSRFNFAVAGVCCRLKDVGRA